MLGICAIYKIHAEDHCGQILPTSFNGNDYKYVPLIRELTTCKRFLSGLCRYSVIFLSGPDQTIYWTIQRSVLATESDISGWPLDFCGPRCIWLLLFHFFPALLLYFAMFLFCFETHDAFHCQMNKITRINKLCGQKPENHSHLGVSIEDMN